MKNVRVEIGFDAPFPKMFTSLQTASSVATAIARAMRSCKKETGRKRIKEYRIKVIQL